MNLRSRVASSLTFSSLALLAVGCADLNGANEVDESHQMLATTNGLGTVNGLSSTNGLGTVNGLSSTNGLGTVNGLSSTNGLMTTAPGRATVEYLVRCALPAGVSITKRDQNGASYTFAGELGLAAGWQNGGCNTDCQETISACMLAHINTAGVHIPLWVVAQDRSVGWILSPQYPNQEGSFFGNIFTTGAHGTDPSKVPAYYCNGIDYNDDVVPGRIGANQVGAPYVDPFKGHGYCKDSCTPADMPYNKSGFKACNGWNHVLTVWRQK
jgi:hypothetical protein